KGRKVVCRLGTLKDGRKVKGVIRAKVSTGARARQKITFRGVVTWGKARTARGFPAVRVAASAAFAVTEPGAATSRVDAAGREPPGRRPGGGGPRRGPAGRDT